MHPYRASHEIYALHFTRMHESRFCLRVEDRRSIEIPFAREELASLIRLWRGSCCLARVHNECTIKDCDCVASLYTTYRVRRCANWFRTSQFIFANTKVFPAASGCTMITRSLLLCSFINDRSIALVSFVQSLHNWRFDENFGRPCAIWCKLIFCWLCVQLSINYILY